MLKSFIFLFLVIIVGCSNPPAPEKIPIKNNAPAKPRPSTVKPAANPWAIGSFAPKEGESEGRKFVRFITEGNFSDSTQSNSGLYAEVLVDKQNAGIFLHKLRKSSPVETFKDPVQIKMTNSSGEELQMTSSRSWNKTGGILIERNNNDYSQFRIFLLQNTGAVTVEIKDSGTRIYNFTINTEGFSDSFTKL